MKITAWAVVPVGEEQTLCYTNAPGIIGGGSVYQIYTNRRDAEEFCDDIPFADAEYEVLEVSVEA